MVLCTDACNEKGPKIKVTQPDPTTLECKGLLYEIDPYFRSVFVLDNCITVNAKGDAMYTMFYRSDDGTCDETWHARVAE